MWKHENKHAPGPWRVGGDDASTVIGETGNVVAECCGYSDRATDAYQRRKGGRESNARLIAAAPELLAACTRALGFVDSMPDNDNVGLADCLRAAIAKAEGREP